MGLLPFTAKVFGRLAIGSKGEKLAVDFLRKNGLRILVKNYRFGRREIDIVAQEKNTICFIEVKTRSTQDFGSPQEAITQKKRHYLTTLALNFIKSHSLLNYNFRFDVVSILWDRAKKTPRIDYIKDAFSVTNKWSL